MAYSDSETTEPNVYTIPVRDSQPPATVVVILPTSASWRRSGVRQRVIPWIGWGLAIVTTVFVAYAAIDQIRTGGLEDPAALIDNVAFGLIGSVFAVLGALIISKRPGNVIGWVLMTPPIGNAIAALSTIYIDSLGSPPTTLDPPLFLATWLGSTSWVFFIFPLFHLLQAFPTGRVINRRWRWLMGLEIFMLVFFLGAVAFSREIQSPDGEWSFANPIGFVGEDFFDRWFVVPWTVGLLILIIGGVVSMILRYRRAQATEREQIKWLLYAFALFAAVYVSFAIFGNQEVDLPLALNLLFPLSIALIPIAITVAVLRYRLFDIDLIIRRTLLYTVLTGLLVLVYLGSVVSLQSVFRGAQDSSLRVAASTLLITALFSPLRRRLQSVIDRRLFRSRYNARQVIERFGGAAQNQADLEILSDDLLAVIQETIQPRFGRLWIRDSA